MQIVKVSKRRLLTVSLTVTLLISLFTAGYTIGQSGLPTVTLSGGSYPGGWTYTVYQEGTTYYAKDRYGANQFSGPVLNTVVSSAVNAGNGIVICQQVLFDNTTITVPAGVLVLQYYQGTAPLAWNNAGPVILGGVGPTGATGAAGTDGATWYSGSGAPAGAIGVIDDHYFRTDNNWVYLKTGALTWTYSANLTGAQGATGPAGTDLTGAPEQPYSFLIGVFPNGSYYAKNGTDNQYVNSFTSTNAKNVIENCFAASVNKDVHFKTGTYDLGAETLNFVSNLHATFESGAVITSSGLLTVNFTDVETSTINNLRAINTNSSGTSVLFSGDTGSLVFTELSNYGSDCYYGILFEYSDSTIAQISFYDTTIDNFQTGIFVNSTASPGSITNVQFYHLNGWHSTKANNIGLILSGATIFNFDDAGIGNVDQTNAVLILDNTHDIVFNNPDIEGGTNATYIMGAGACTAITFNNGIVHDIVLSNGVSVPSITAVNTLDFTGRRYDYYFGSVTFYNNQSYTIDLSGLLHEPPLNVMLMNTGDYYGNYVYLTASGFGAEHQVVSNVTLYYIAYTRPR